MAEHEPTDGSRTRGSIADVDQFRRMSVRNAVARGVDLPTLVLGSTQHENVLDRSALRNWPGDVVRRRGGGGAVLLRPGDHLWIDVWIPRVDPLWRPDVSLAANWVGEWWRAALESTGAGTFDVHRGSAVPGRYRAVCFSGRGPGEVFRQNAKIVGVSQWRSREGALFHTCAYTHWDAAPLVELLDLDEVTRAEWRRGLAGAAIGVDAVVPGGAALAGLTEILLSTFPIWS